MKHLEGLNDAQREAVLSIDGPLLVLAGAGAGKTRVITARIAEIVRHGVAPREILAVTFTNKAAKEMRERALSLLGTLTWEERPVVTTFHSLGLTIIKENARALGLPKNPVIFDRSDSLRTMKEAMKKVGISAEEFEPRRLLGAISKQKGNGTSLAEYREALSGGDFFPGVVARVWEGYEGLLREEHALDFDDLLLRATLLLARDEAVRTAYQKRWRYLEIDEYQDTNRVQNTMTLHLTSPERTICAVGDIDQNIYSWRGAELANILSFEKRFGSPERPVRVILLEENYRSTQTILAAANEIIRKNQFRREKNLYTKNAPGEPLSLYIAFDEGDEAQFVAARAGELIERGVPRSDIAVLFRANFQSRALEEAFLARDIPYQVLGTRFFERAEVKDLLSYLRLALGPETPFDLKRAIGSPPRGIGKVTLLKILAGREEELPPATREKVRRFRALLARAKEYLETNPPSAGMRFILKESGMEEHLLSGDEEDRERLENLRELVSLASRYDALPPREGLEALLMDAALATDQDELSRERDAVKLMTVHAAKGLEFSHVFITGLEEGLFPHEKDEEAGEEAREEERRLFYVALTRAKRKLHLSFASMRTIYGNRSMSVMSSFIADIPEHLLVPENPERQGKVIYLD